MCPASSACVVWKFIVIVGGPGWKCGGPTYCLFAQPHGEVHYVVRRRWMIEHKQQVFMRRSIVSLLPRNLPFWWGLGCTDRSPGIAVCRTFMPLAVALASRHSGVQVHKQVDACSSQKTMDRIYHKFASLHSPLVTPSCLLSTVHQQQSYK